MLALHRLYHQCPARQRTLLAAWDTLLASRISSLQTGAVWTAQIHELATRSLLAGDAPLQSPFYVLVIAACAEVLQRNLFSHADSDHPGNEAYLGTQ